MLVLSRRLNETILLPGIDTTVELLPVRGGSVLISIQAPQAVVRLRGAVCERGKGRRPVPDLPRGAAPPDLPRLNHVKLFNREILLREWTRTFAVRS
jgi:carbon storage regulator CsrA